MSVSRGRRSRESRASPSARRKVSNKVDANQRKFIRSLAHALLEVIDGKSHSDGDNGEMAVVTEEEDSKSRCETEKTKDSKTTQGRGKSLQSQLAHKARGNEKRDPREELRNIARFKKLRENHGQLTYQIQSSLNALGGGGRTAKALEQMHEEVIRVTGLFYDSNEKTDLLRPDICTETLGTCKEAASEVLEAFKELGVYNKDFFDTIEKIIKQLEDLAVKFDVEYGHYNQCQVDRYLDSIFEPLIVEFESFLSGLTNIAEKEIAAIRSSQDFASQRYLNLTTVATFLSSVTATTLQITADDSDFPLTPITNTLWFVSLVFSTASAVYSLLVMTWRQSSVCQPNLSLPRTLNIWFRNGPMYTLIAAVLTFSIGLCLLAFHIAKEQGGIVIAAIPTAFAGVHAYAIFIFSAWFLLEQWKARHRESWVSVKDTYLIPLASTHGKLVEEMKQLGIRVKDDLKYKGQRHLASLTTSLRNLRLRMHAFGRHNAVSPGYLNDDSTNDIESGQDVPPPIASLLELGAISPIPITPRDEQDMSVQALAPPQPILEPAGESQQTPATAELESVLANPETQAVSENEEKNEAVNQVEGEWADDGWVDPNWVTYRPFENILQFSPDGRFLAAAHSDAVTIYNVGNQFSIFRSIKAPDGDQIKEIEWNPIPFPFGMPSMYDAELLVRSIGGVSTWNVQSSQPDGHMVGHLSELVGSAHWTDLQDGWRGTRAGLICTIGTIVKIFDDRFKEMRSINLSGLRSINRIIDVTSLGPKYILCLSDGPDSFSDSFLVINEKDISIERTLEVSPGHISMIVSSEAEKIMFYGSEHGVEFVDFQASESGDEFVVTVDYTNKLLYNTFPGHELRCPEEAVTFHGKKHGLVIGYSAGEVVVLHCDDRAFSAVHIFTTPITGAMPQNPISFTLNTGRQSMPYMFALSNERGVVTIWSIQSNTALSKCKHAASFKVRDRRGGRLDSEEPVVTSGRFLVLPPPEASG